MEPGQNTDHRLMHRCSLTDINQAAREWYRLRMYAPQIAGLAEPGQFVHLRAGSATDPLLRRPFSIHFADLNTGEIWLLIRIAGKVTAKLARLRPGESIDLLGPLGNGYPATDEAGVTLLVAGGIGLAPLFFLAMRRLKAALPFELILGGLTGDALPDDTYFLQHGLRPLIATDDGSRGFRGTAADLLAERLKSGSLPQRIHACGPELMLARVVETGRAYGLPVYVSLESLLACAVGACLGCAFPFKAEGSVEYRRVCRDGPVFNGEEVCFGHV